MSLIFCLHWSYKKYHAILGYDPKILLANQLAGFFIFDMWDLLNLITGVHCYVVIVLCVEGLRFIFFYPIKNQTFNGDQSRWK